VKELVGSFVPEEGVELEINGRPWRVIDTVPGRDIVRVVLEEVECDWPGDAGR
jgi:hypothetical protein